MFCQYIFTTETLQTTFAKVFILCFVKDKSVKIFDVHIIWLVFINYKQQIYRIFKFLIWNVDWKSQLVLIAKHINTNIVLRFNLAKILFSHRKSNSINFIGLICLTWHHKKHFWSLSLMLDSPFLGILNLVGNFT